MDTSEMVWRPKLFERRHAFVAAFKMKKDVIPEIFYRGSMIHGFPTLSEKNVKFFPKSAPRMGASVKTFGNDKVGGFFQRKII